MPFVQELPLWLEPVDARFWRLVYPLVYRGARGDVITVPAGWFTDLATVPRAFTPYVPRYGDYTLAAIVHDYLCDKKKAGQPVPGYESWADIDGIFRRILREQGVPLPRREAMWAGVRAASFLQDISGAEFGRWLLVALTAGPLYGLGALLTSPVLVIDWLLQAPFRHDTPRYDEELGGFR